MSEDNNISPFVPGHETFFGLALDMLRFRLTQGDQVLVAGLHGKEYLVPFVCQDIGEAGRKSNFDAGLCFLTIYRVANTQAKQAFFRHTIGQLRQGASFFVFDLCGKASDDGFLDSLEEWAEMVQIEQGVSIADAHAAIDAVLTMPFVAPEIQEEILREAGFEKVRRIFQYLCFHGWIASVPQTSLHYPETSDEVEEALRTEVRRERRRAERLAARLRELGINPNAS